MAHKRFALKALRSQCIPDSDLVIMTDQDRFDFLEKDEIQASPQLISASSPV